MLLRSIFVLLSEKKDSLSFPYIFPSENTQYLLKKMQLKIQFFFS